MVSLFSIDVYFPAERFENAKTRGKKGRSIQNRNVYKCEEGRKMCYIMENILAGECRAFLASGSEASQTPLTRRSAACVSKFHLYLDIRTTTRMRT